MQVVTSKKVLLPQEEVKKSYLKVNLKPPLHPLSLGTIPLNHPPTKLFKNPSHVRKTQNPIQKLGKLSLKLLTRVGRPQRNHSTYRKTASLLRSKGSLERYLKGISARVVINQTRHLGMTKKRWMKGMG